MRLVPDLPRVGPGGWAWTSTGLHVCRGHQRPGSCREGQEQRDPANEASVAWFPLPLLWPSSAPPHPLQAKEASNFSHSPRCQVGKWV